MSYIMRILGFVLELCYNLIGNYGLAIIVFTLLIKAVLLPLTVKQQKSMVKTQKIQPLLMEVQKKYGHDKEKLNQETMKLYQKYKINPMSGCLPLLIQLPIIMALYWVVRKPITYIMGVDGAEIWRVITAFNDWAQAAGYQISENVAKLEVGTFGNYEIQVAQQMFLHPEILDHPFIAEAGFKLTPINFNFLGLDLSETPSLGALFSLITGSIAAITPRVAILWLIPLLSGLTSFLASKIGTMLQPQNNTNKPGEENSQANTMKTMMAIMPLFSAWITFSLPAAVGLYWIISNLLQVIQQFVVTKFFTPDITDEQIEGEVVQYAKKSRKKRKKS